MSQSNFLKRSGHESMKGGRERHSKSLYISPTLISKNKSLQKKLCIKNLSRVPAT